MGAEPTAVGAEPEPTAVGAEPAAMMTGRGIPHFGVVGKSGGPSASGGRIRPGAGGCKPGLFALGPTKPTAVGAEPAAMGFAIRPGAMGLLDEPTAVGAEPTAVGAEPAAKGKRSCRAPRSCRAR